MSGGFEELGVGALGVVCSWRLLEFRIPLQVPFAERSFRKSFPEGDPALMGGVLRGPHPKPRTPETRQQPEDGKGKEKGKAQRGLDVEGRLLLRVGMFRALGFSGFQGIKLRGPKSESVFACLSNF